MKNKEKIIFMNFWKKGGMKHYSNAIVNTLIEDKEVIYFTNYRIKLNCKNEYYNLTLNPFNPVNYFYLIIIMIKILKIKPEVIHLNSGFPILFFIYPFFYFYNSIITIHEAVLPKGESTFKKISYKLQLILFYLFFKKVIVHSEIIKNQLPKYFRKKSIFIVPHINYNYLVNKELNYKRKKTKFTILFFGRMLPYKGLKYLLKVYKNLPEKEYQLIIAGEGKIDCKIPNKENIKVINRFVSDNEMNELFNKTDIVILPYLSASQSGIIYLSFAFNKPVIATNVGAIPEIVKNEFNGLLVEPKSSKQIVNAIRKMNNKKFYGKLVNNIKNQNESEDKEILKKLRKIYNEK